MLAIDMGYIAVFFAVVVCFLGYLLGKGNKRELIETIIDQLIEDKFIKVDPKTEQFIRWNEWHKDSD